MHVSFASLGSSNSDTLPSVSFALPARTPSFLGGGRHQQVDLNRVEADVLSRYPGPLRVGVAVDGSRLSDDTTEVAGERDHEWAAAGKAEGRTSRCSSVNL